MCRRILYILTCDLIGVDFLLQNFFFLPLIVVFVSVWSCLVCILCWSLQRTQGQCASCHNAVCSIGGGMCKIALIECVPPFWRSGALWQLIVPFFLQKLFHCPLHWTATLSFNLLPYYYKIRNYNTTIQKHLKNGSRTKNQKNNQPFPKKTSRCATSINPAVWQIKSSRHSTTTAGYKNSDKIWPYITQQLSPFRIY